MSTINFPITNLAVNFSPDITINKNNKTEKPLNATTDDKFDPCESTPEAQIDMKALQSQTAKESGDLTSFLRICLGVTAAIPAAAVGLVAGAAFVATIVGPIAECIYLAKKGIGEDDAVMNFPFALATPLLAAGACANAAYQFATTGKVKMN